MQDCKVEAPASMGRNGRHRFDPGGSLGPTRPPSHVARTFYPGIRAKGS